MNEQADLLLMEVEEHMTKTVEALGREFAAVRTGRANPALLDHVKVDYYGAESPIRQVSSVGVVEGNQLYIKPYDKSILKQIETAIFASDLGLNPINDGSGIRLIFPQPTEERRRELVREVDKLGEQAKVAIRNIRREANDQVKKLELSEDDEKGYLEDVQELTNQFVKSIDDSIKEKSNELLKM